MKPLNLRARIILLLALLLPLLLLSLHNFAQLLPMPAHSIRQLIVLQGWLPRLVISLLCGAALGLAGLLFQQTLRNPLAEPMTLGVAAGAQLALSLVTIFLPHWLVAGTQTVTLIGAITAAGLVLVLSASRGLEPSRVAIAGLVVSLFCGSVITVLQLLYAPYLHSLFIWGAGSLVQAGWGSVRQLAGQLLVGWLLALLLRRPLQLLGLGELHASSLGLRTQYARLAGFALAVLLTAAVVSAVGVIGFVGLAAPALARLIGARRQLHQLLLAPLCGALLLWGTDQAVQPFANALGELVPTGAATALFGAPLILWLLFRLRTTSMPLAPVSAGAGESIHTDHRVSPLSLGLFVLLALCLLLSVFFGRSPSGWAFTPLSHLTALLPWRVPREVAACAAGMMLAAAGVLLQRLTGNRLASPEMMGVSAGAALGMLALTLMVGSTSHALRLGVTTGGALVTLLIILSFSRRHHFSPDRVLLAGVTISALFQALVATVIAAGDERAITLLNWLSGSTYSIMPRDAEVAAGMALILSVLTLFFRRWLSILPLGAACAASVGVTLAQARLLTLTFIAMLTASATLIVGPVSFVGLTAPHIARLLGARRPGQQLLLALPSGALMMVVADWAGRTLLAPRELPAGLVATLLGAPYMMWLLTRRGERS
ncbi:MAG: Fe(3+)-hydroxamate ABC transporter permease FhuB [Pantoea sp.]|uniref:Fe(3+)-hydroxamate ABC transporter permease FhuB n=1 Tax=Pantoea sp. TaxID=69393 RepID=UPI00239C3D9F|nr:Fe(3+)-hydroxamate ABC transporter permease FhuB [Pantoea sp.]MDE1184939.1 Fe(3+)-hydroxamate ABC transporter permease FhuB [Pantoea sp.]